jgi:hypothetical protein
MTKQEILAIVGTPKEFKGKLCDQHITVYSDHKIFTQDALGFTWD